MNDTRLKLSQLGSIAWIAGGGQGDVYSAPGVRMKYTPSLVYKEYKQNVLNNLDVAVLSAMPSYLESLPLQSALELLSLAAWPCRLVEGAGKVTGFVMPEIPSKFSINMMKAKGLKKVLGEFQHLLNDEDFLQRRQIHLSDLHRFSLLEKTASALDFFHSHNIVVGDLSPKNLLFSLNPDVNVYFIDCDAMRFKGRTVLKQLESPEWEVQHVNKSEELGTAQSDAYKFGLLALRLFAGDQLTRDINRLPKSVPSNLRDLIIRSLDSQPDVRPTISSWIGLLGAAKAKAARTPNIPKNKFNQPLSQVVTPTFNKGSTHTTSQTPPIQPKIQTVAPSAPKKKASPANKSFYVLVYFAYLLPFLAVMGLQIYANTPLKPTDVGAGLLPLLNWFAVLGYSIDTKVSYPVAEFLGGFIVFGVILWLILSKNGFRNIVLSIFGFAVGAIFLLPEKGDEPEIIIQEQPKSFSIVGDAVKSLSGEDLLIRQPIAYRVRHTEALAACQNLNYLGFDDWKVPSDSELAIFRDASKDLGMSAQGFFGGPDICGSHRPAASIWLSNTRESGNLTWGFKFSCPYGDVTKSVPPAMVAAVICFRSGSQDKKTEKWSGRSELATDQHLQTIKEKKTHLKPVETYKGFVKKNVGKGWVVTSTFSEFNYMGQILNDQPHGRGILTTEKERYDGKFVDGMFHSGTYITTLPNGLNEYEGSFAGNKPNGRGKFTSHDKKVYEGIWENGCFNDGRRYLSLFTTDEACGFKSKQKAANIQQEQAQPQTNDWWHYCRNPDGYYPYIKECPDGWIKVKPQPLSQYKENTVMKSNRNRNEVICILPNGNERELSLIECRANQGVILE